MAPMEQVGEVAVPSLLSSFVPDAWLDEVLKSEMAVQSLWETHIPAWHPTNDGTDAGGDAGNGSGDNDGSDAGDKGGDTGKSAPTQEDLDTAYAKLREAEKERDKLRSDNTKLTRAGMDELERTKQELEDARLEAAALQEKADEVEREKDVVELAKGLKFKKPEKAMRFVSKDSKDAKAIKADLKEALEDFPELGGEAPPPPPVNDGGKNGGGAANARMNSVIRRMAGRS